MNLITHFKLLPIWNMIFFTFGKWKRNEKNKNRNDHEIEPCTKPTNATEITRKKSVCNCDAVLWTENASNRSNEKKNVIVVVAGGWLRAGTSVPVILEYVTRTYEEICILIYLMVTDYKIECMIVCDSIFHLLHLSDSLGSISLSLSLASYNFFISILLDLVVDSYKQ